MATFTAQFLVNDTSGSFEGFSGEVTETETITLGSPTTATVNGSIAGLLRRYEAEVPRITAGPAGAADNGKSSTFTRSSGLSGRVTRDSSKAAQPVNRWQASYEWLKITGPNLLAP